LKKKPILKEVEDRKNHDRQDRDIYQEAFKELSKVQNSPAFKKVRDELHALLGESMKMLLTTTFHDARQADLQLREAQTIYQMLMHFPKLSINFVTEIAEMDRQEKAEWQASVAKRYHIPMGESNGK
jgi:ketosteroid isomerase-like protein